MILLSYDRIIIQNILLGLVERSSAGGFAISEQSRSADCDGDSCRNRLRAVGGVAYARQVTGLRGGACDRSWST